MLRNALFTINVLCIIVVFSNAAEKKRFNDFYSTSEMEINKLQIQFDSDSGAIATFSIPTSKNEPLRKTALKTGFYFPIKGEKGRILLDVIKNAVANRLLVSVRFRCRTVNNEIEPLSHKVGIDNGKIKWEVTPIHDISLFSPKEEEKQ
jgi:hypothetical protein